MTSNFAVQHAFMKSRNTHSLEVARSSVLPNTLYSYLLITNYTVEGAQQVKGSKGTFEAAKCVDSDLIKVFFERKREAMPDCTC